MEFAEHGNLLQFLKTCMSSVCYQEAAHGHRLKRESCDKRNKRNIMEDKQLMSLVWQIAKGMAHLTLMKVDAILALYSVEYTDPNKIMTNLAITEV